MQWCEQVDHFFANKQVQSRLAVLATRIMTRCPVQTSTKKYDKNLIKQAVTVIVKLQRLIEKHYNTTKNVFFYTQFYILKFLLTIFLRTSLN